MAMGWAAYKTALIVADGSGDGSMRVQRAPATATTRVSEAISYGMLFAVYMNDKATFDNLWKYEQKHLDTHGLMNWHINSSGTTASGGTNSATDADEDMAFALVMADKQWGGYTTVAKNMLGDRRDERLRHRRHHQGRRHLRRGQPLVPRARVLPGVRRATRATRAGRRSSTRPTSILSMVADATTGLVPDWSAGRTGAGNYTYDATRTPFRIALDACWSDDPRAVTFSQKIGGFFAGIGAANIKDGYNLNGTATGTYHNSSFVGPAGAAGMAVEPGQAGRRRLHLRHRRREGDDHQLLRPIVGAVLDHADDRQLHQPRGVLTRAPRYWKLP